MDGIKPGDEIDVRMALPDVVVALLDDGAVLTAMGKVYLAGTYFKNGRAREKTTVMSQPIRTLLSSKNALAPASLKPGDLVGIFDEWGMIFLVVKEEYIPRQAMWATVGGWVIKLNDQNVALLDLRNK